MGGILVAGAINTDLVATVERAPEAGETITGLGFAVYGGGKGANQAVAAARAGARVTLIGAVGDDDFGRGRLADLTADGIVTSWIQTTTEASSGVALITVETHGENRIAYIPGAVHTVTSTQALAALEATQPTIVLAPYELRPAALRALFTRARELGAIVILNVSPDPDDAKALLDVVDVLIANEGEAATISGLPDGASIEEILVAVRALGPSRVALTLGGDGVIGADGDETFAIPARTVEVVDTTGAGDTFAGTLAASLSRGASFREAVTYASTAASLSVTKAGAQSSIPTHAETEAALASS